MKEELLTASVPVVILLLIFLYWSYFTKDIHGNSWRQVRRVFKKNLKRCNALGTRVHYNPFTRVFKRSAPGECTTYSMIIGKGKFEDHDTLDSSDAGFDFRIGKGRSGDITILKGRGII